MLRPAPRRILRKASGVLVRIVAGMALFAVLITAGTFAAKGLILLIAAFPWRR